MSRRTFVRTAERGAWILLASCLLSGCWLESKPPQTVHARRAAPGPQYTADDFLGEVALTHLALAQGADGAAVEPHLAIIEAYTSQKQQKTTTVTGVEFSYVIQGRKGVQHLVAPMTPASAEDTSALLAVASTLSAAPYTLQDIYPVVITVPPLRPVKFSDDPVATRYMIGREAHLLQQKAEPPLPLREAELQLSLAQLFTRHRLRDAAYLSLENAKVTLADIAESGPEGDQRTQALSHEVDTTEVQLHASLPFSIKSF